MLGLCDFREHTGRPASSGLLGPLQNPDWAPNNRASRTEMQRIESAPGGVEITEENVAFGFVFPFAIINSHEPYGIRVYVSSTSGTGMVWITVCRGNTQSGSQKSKPCPGKGRGPERSQVNTPELTEDTFIRIGQPYASESARAAEDTFIRCGQPLPEIRPTQWYAVNNPPTTWRHERGGCQARPGPLKFRAPFFFPAFGASFIFPLKCRFNWDLKIRVKNKFQAPVDQKCPLL